MPAVDFDPFAPEHRPNPYPLYRRLREEAPVYQSPRGPWLLTRYADCVALMRDDRFGHGTRQRLLDKSKWRKPAEGRALPFILLDPPEHTRQRVLASRAFTPRAVHRQIPLIEKLVDEMLDAVIDAGEVDLVEAFAYPLPATVISGLLGVPAADRELVRGWSSLIARGVDPDYQYSADQKRERDEALASFDAYFAELAAEKRRNPADDLLTALIAVRDEGAGGDEGGEGEGRLSEPELLSICTMIYVAGHETTTDLLANGTLALLKNPEEFRRLRADPAGLAESAVEEFLRYDPPTQLTRRTALEDAKLDGHLISRGEQVIIVRGAANRDPSVFPDPDRLDLGRTPNKHIAFDGGIHFCLGAALARLEGRIAFAALANRTSDIELATDEPAYRSNVTIRGLSALPVRLRS
ncbi:cytochrome P450 [Actinomadura barringtoniae]|uniref:Cytochrome P450 n=1 Tax=Actinomadura barringtoniae TaxID=1427535 RepID=A0A939T482_9ACTN|nr:cytochrome P450 [Actinomadura barringtoniae]MBO2445567.1 cytochrome P450 [Actinomadura barringtoniae]